MMDSELLLTFSKPRLTLLTHSLSKSTLHVETSST